MRGFDNQGFVILLVVIGLLFILSAIFTGMAIYSYELESSSSVKRGLLLSSVELDDEIELDNEVVDEEVVQEDDEVKKRKNERAIFIEEFEEEIEEIEYEINSCGFVINISGNYYLKSDLNSTGKGSCIVVENIENVVIDGRGYSVIGTRKYTEKYGIHFKGVENSQIYDLEISNFYSHGIFFQSSSNNSLSGINISDINQKNGIYFFSSNNNVLSGIASDNNRNGIFFQSSSNNSLSGINASKNKDYGIAFYSSSNNRVFDTILSENGLHDFFISALEDVHCNPVFENVFLSDGKEIKFYNYPVEINDEEFASLILCNADNSNITNVKIKGSGEIKNNGLQIVRTSNSYFENITSNDNAHGVYLLSSNNNTLLNITAKDNILQGVFFSSSSNNFLSEVIIESSEGSGIGFSSSSYNLVLNVFVNSSHSSRISTGISFDESLYNNLSNIVVNNRRNGILLISSLGNVFSNVNITNNIHGLAFSLSSVNVFSNILAKENDYGVLLSSTSNHNQIKDSFACGNSHWDLSCEGDSFGNSGTGNTFGSVQTCEDGWPDENDYSTCPE